MIKIVIPGPPIPKARARTFQRKGITQTYDPQHKEKLRVRKIMIKQFNEAFDNPNTQMAKNASNLACGESFRLKAIFYLPVPKSLSTSQKNAKLWHLELPVAKPDLSNMLKFYEDCANEVLFHDDSQLVSVMMFKRYSHNPRTELYLMPEDPLNVSEAIEKVLKIISQERLEEFVDDAKRLERAYQEEVDQSNRLAVQDWISTTAGLLIQFAKKYNDEIKKIAKVDYEERSQLHAVGSQLEYTQEVKE